VSVAEMPEVGMPEVEVSEEELRRRRVNEELVRMAQERPEALAQVLRAWLIKE